jgi:Spy/CpxP family protein refolding chaperone
MMGGYGMGPGMMGGYGMGPGMMGGYGMGPGMMGWGLYGLNLSAKQRDEINKIFSDMHEKHWALMQAMHQDAAELYKLYSQETPDAKAIGKIYGQIFDMQRQMIEDGITSQNRVNAILTKEQREQLREQAREGWGWRHPRNRR